MFIGERLKAIVKQKGLSAKQFASMVDVSEAMVYKYYKMDNVDSNTLKKWSESLNVGILDFLQDADCGGIGEPVKCHITEEDIQYDNFNGALVYDIDATCGMDERDMMFANDTIIGSVDLPFINKSSHIIRASGDSMEPKVHNGDFIVIREINDFQDIFYGQIYLIILDEYRMIKYIRRYEQDEQNYIILRSENERYDDITLHKSKIRKLFVVENILSITNQI